jgi:hypothetical protein
MKNNIKSEQQSVLQYLNKNNIDDKTKEPKLKFEMLSVQEETQNSSLREIRSNGPRITRIGAIYPGSLG